ncbi:unnamed protein product, partial [Iphiclides podalirius]
MAQILKNVWRNVLSGSSLGKTSFKSASFTTSLSEVTRVRTQDVIMASIKAAPTPENILATVQQHLPVMTHKHLLQALRSLFELQKSGKFDHSESLIKDPAFGVLCQNFKKHARALDVNEAVEAVKVLSYLKVPSDSLIVQTMLQLIRSDINLLNIRQIMFLDFVLDRFDSKNHLVDVLKLALPLAFQIHLPLELDNDDLPLLKDMLTYCCHHDLPDRCVNNVVTGLLLHDQAIDAQTAKSIVWSLCQINCTEQLFPTRLQLLHICFDILSQRIDELPYSDVLRTIAKVKGRVLEKHPEYYHELLLDSAADYVIRNNVDFDNALLVARVLSRVAHTHLGLMEYLCNLATRSPNHLAGVRTNILFSFINCLSNNNYTPDGDKWETIRRDLSENPILKATNAALPWTKVCLELASLGHYEDKLLNRIFSEEFLEDYLSREKNVLDLLQLLTLHEAVNAFHSTEYKLPARVLEKAKAAYPVHAITDHVRECMARAIGGEEYVAKNVVLPSGVVADLFMSLKNGNPVQLPKLALEGGRIPIEEIKLPSGSMPVCILIFNQGCYSMNSNRLRGAFRLVLDTLERQGFAAVPLNVTEWLKAPPHERVPYLLRESKYGYVSWINKKPVFKESNSPSDIPSLHVARATYKNEINQTGWAFLEVHTSQDCSDEKQAFAAGFIEGFLTRDLIWMHWQNMLKGYCYNKTVLCGLIEEFLDKNEEYIARMVKDNQLDPYWYQVKLYYIQLEGLAMGYNDATTEPYQWLTVRDIIWINMLGDLDDLAYALSVSKDFPDDLLFGAHCTGLVKLLPDLSDLYTGHTTWNSYQSMLRIQKMYVLHFKTSSNAKIRIPGYKMSFSSYPGFVQSTDDFYIVSSGLVVAETTISNSNSTLFKLISPEGSVMEYIRGMVACRLASDGHQWTRIFREHNSGTYNNQWFIVDYNKFTPRTNTTRGAVKNGLLWVIEQLPGFTESSDLTDQLVANTYFPAYNIPYFPAIFNMSGGNERVRIYGDWFGYGTNPRAKILKKMQAKIGNLRDMYKTMRYNDFKHDPLARCEQCSPPYSACNAIAARNDLNPANGSYPFRALGHRSHGGTDTKVTSAHLRHDYQFVSVSGPTHNISRGIPPFVWSEFDMGPHVMHIGHPDLWMFAPIVHRWEWQ